MPKEKITVVLMCCNRTTYLKEAIDSVIDAVNNFSDDIRFYISDNSTTNSVEIFLEQAYPDIITIKRMDPSRVEQHHNLIIKETQTDFLMMLHDDDKIHPQLINKLYKEIINDDKTGAVASNSQVINSIGDLRKRKMFKSNNKKICISKVSNLLPYYFRFIRNGNAPFPSYMYRVKSIKDFIWSEKTGGKYSDVSMLCYILKEYRIIWLNDVLFSYREHAQNGNNTVNILHKIFLYKYLKTLSDSPKMLYNLRFRTHISIMRKRWARSIFYYKSCYWKRLFSILFCRLR